MAVPRATDPRVARLRALIEARLPVPTDLAGFVLDAAERAARSTPMAMRDRIIRDAAALIGGTHWQRAAVLASVAARPGGGPIAERLAAARAHADLPSSIRQFHRVLTDTD